MRAHPQGSTVPERGSLVVKCGGIAMRVERDWLRNLIFSFDDARRFTQDSPIMPDVWLIAGMFYCRDSVARVDLLFTPFKTASPSELAAALQSALVEAQTPEAPSRPPRGVHREEELIWADGRPARRVVLRSSASLAVSQTNVAAALTLEELIVVAMPLTDWWSRNVKGNHQQKPSSSLKSTHDGDQLTWMRRVVGVMLLCGKTVSDHGDIARHEDAPAYLSADEAGRLLRARRSDAEKFADFMRDETGQKAEFDRLLDRADKIYQSVDRLLWRVNLNRGAFTAISRSVPTTKSDAARRVFNVNCESLCWAVVDSGIDPSHPALCEADGTSRVDRAYDFRDLRALLSLDSSPKTGPGAAHRGDDTEIRDRNSKRLRESLKAGRALDWATLLPLITIGAESPVRVPTHDHGTHVAGILAARKLTEDDHGEGVCPDIRLCDLRVLDNQGRGDEFALIAALQFIRYLNATSDRRVIHGVNLSLSLLHDVENYACGSTPVCEECERLVNSGVVVVAAAGNRGYERVLTPLGEIEAYRSISITDPGNCAALITVGSTHRFEPHTYGTSYFSSRGPTGDGRMKPDLLAPGEKIESTVLAHGFASKDGTSMAAPHVSGVAALLMARHSELMGKPAQIKKILCTSATDLGRERYFQGHGLVDALRALQSV
jgi:serine protease AprX